MNKVVIVPSDIVKIWKKLYKERGWSKFARFDSKGGFNRPYLLFKLKNVISAETHTYQILLNLRGLPHWRSIKHERSKGR